MSLKEDNHPKKLLLTVLIYEKLFVSQVFSRAITFYRYYYSNSHSFINSLIIFIS